MRKVIVNSTPMIALAKCRKLELLRKMYERIIIPEAVFKELTFKEDIVSTSLEENLNWIEVKKIRHTEDRKLFKTRLHDGEVEVMILARELNADVVIIDDLAARNTAEYYHLPVTGTLGVLIKAKKNGLIDEVMPVIKEMQHQHIYFSESLIALIREKAGE